MNERQKRFCEFYAMNPNATEAAKAAGYSPTTARSIGQRLLTNVDIKNHIAELTADARTERVATISEMLEYLTATMRNEKEATNERTKAARQLWEMLRADKGTDATPVTEIQITFEDAGGGTDNAE